MNVRNVRNVHSFFNLETIFSAYHNEGIRLNCASSSRSRTAT